MVTGVISEVNGEVAVFSTGKEFLFHQLLFHQTLTFENRLRPRGGNLKIHSRLLRDKRSLRCPRVLVH